MIPESHVEEYWVTEVVKTRVVEKRYFRVVAESIYSGYRKTLADKIDPVTAKNYSDGWNDCVNEYEEQREKQLRERVRVAKIRGKRIKTVGDLEDEGE